jgi:hypothetical protein
MNTDVSLDTLATPEQRNRRLADLLRTLWVKLDIVEIHRLPHAGHPQHPDSGWLVVYK